MAQKVSRQTINEYTCEVEEVWKHEKQVVRLIRSATPARKRRMRQEIKEQQSLTRITAHLLVANFSAHFTIPRL